MPKGVYQHKKMCERSPEVQETMRRCLQVGRSQPVRDAVRVKLKQNAQSMEWREKVGQATKAALWRPDVRAKHLASMVGLEVNFKGGNGQEPVPKVKELAERLKPLGFVLEYPIKTKGHGTGLRVPTCYKVDFGHPSRKVAVEVDGISHRRMEQRRKDVKKSLVLRALGWVVARVKH